MLFWFIKRILEKGQLLFHKKTLHLMQCSRGRDEVPCRRGRNESREMIDTGKKRGISFSKIPAARCREQNLVLAGWARRVSRGEKLGDIGWDISFGEDVGGHLLGECASNTATLKVREIELRTSSLFVRRTRSRKIIGGCRWAAYSRKKVESAAAVRGESQEESG